MDQLDPEGATDSAMSFGLINALRTGNVLIDMCVCMLIPLVLKFAMLCVTGGLPKMWNMLLRLLEGKHKFEFIRNVEVLKRTSWSDLIGQHDTKNELLQKAIQMYIGTLELKYTTCDSRLKAIKDDNYYDDESGATHEQLKRYRIVRLPTEGEWCTVTPGVEFMHSLDINDKSDENGGGGGKSNTMRSLYCFRSYQEDGESLIDSFISKCFQYYKEEMEKHEATGRFMYTLAAAPVKTTTDEDDGDDVGDGHNYRRYKLSEDKTFETWFNPSKDGLLSLVNQFLEKKGKFGVKGFPHKLGLLLHGPPGTGKTSFIKCLAQYTKRNIVSIPLARIQTNQELMDIMFDMRYKVVGEDLPVRLNFDEVVFVMEDIDCASDIVCTRQKQIRRSEEKGESYLLTREMTEEEEDTVATTAAVSAALGADDKEEGQKKKKKDFLSPSVDKLNLSGLLNVLDGVVDMPGRILVMTTNHPERLDPALIRPGRVNKRLFLGYLTRDDTAKMIERYFAEAEGGGVLTPEQKEQLPDERLTPAEMEQLCAEAETLVALLELVQDLLAKQPPRHPRHPQDNPVRFA